MLFHAVAYCLQRAGDGKCSWIEENADGAGYLLFQKVRKPQQP